MAERPAEKVRFDSWKEISLYLNRTIRTCYRWCNDLGLPVYRVDRMSKRSRVFAYKNEIDEWFRGKVALKHSELARGEGKTDSKRTRERIRDE
jgi:hypothetical protein